MSGARWPYVDLALARRLERAEGMANAAFVDARAELRPESGATWIEVAGTRAMFDGVGSPITQTFGLGVFDAVGVAVLAGASTVPRLRGRGGQRALLDARLRHAVEQGADLAMMATAPGSVSQRNAEREGFRIAYTRIKWRG